MKNILYIIVSFLLLTVSLEARSYGGIIMGLTCYSEVNDIVEKVDYNKFGIMYDATDSLDFDLGERDLPTMAPPNSLAAYFLFYNMGEEIWSYKDYRKKKTEHTGNLYKHIYKLHIEWGNGVNHSIKWNIGGDARNVVKQAIFKSVIPEVVLNIDMLEQDSIFIDNKYLHDFFIEITYEVEGSSVEEVSHKQLIYPNPCHNTINLPIDNYDKNYYIYDTKGNLILEGKANETQINVNSIQMGVYYLYIDNKKYKFLKN